MGWQTNYLNFKNRAALDSLKTNQLRAEAFSNFENSGLPTKKDEAWKFTSLAGFKNVEWTLPSGEETFLTHEQMQEVSKQLPSEFLNFVFVNGILNKTLSDDPEGFFEIVEVTEADFKTDSENVEGRLLNLAHAFLNKKTEMKLAKGKTIEQPVQIVYIQSSAAAVYGSEKVNVQLEENSEMQLLLTTMSFNNGRPDAMNLNVDVKVGPQARLKLIQLQNEDTQSFHFSQVNLVLESSAHVSTLALSIGNKLTRNFYHLSFVGQNAEAQVYGVSVLDGDQHADNYTFIQHQIGHNQSVQHYKSIVSGEAHSVFRGRVQIAQDAQKANSEQLNNNLLLTRTAQADSVPQLEIFADDVKAGHGSTVGQLNKDEIFYFLSRGVNQFQAVQMLSYGFASELIYKFETPSVQNFLLNALNKKLEKLVQNG